MGLLSIEIDDRNIKIVEAYKKGDVLTVLKCLTIKSHLNTYDGKIDNIDYIVSIIKEELNRNFIKTKKAIFVINSNSIITRKIKLPLLKKNSEILSMLKFELEQLMSIDLNQYKIIYKVVEIIDEKNSKHAIYSVYCLPEYIINQYINLSKKLKLKLVCIDISYNCLNKISTHNLNINNKELKFEEIYAFVNIDLFWGSFCVINNGTNDFSRISVIENMNSFEIAAEETAYYGSDKSLNTPDYMSLWLEEISKYIRYYYSIDNTKNIKKLFIYGECSDLNGISEYLSKNLNIDVEKINIISNLQFDSIFSFDYFPAKSYFNSILSLFNDKYDINFCKENHNNYKYGIRTYATIFSIALLIIGLIFYVFVYSNFSLKNKIKYMNLYINDKNNVELNSQLEEIKNENLILESYLKEIEILENIVENSDHVSSYMFIEIYNVIPLNTKVTTMSVDGNNIQMTCVSESMEGAAIFIQDLRKIKFIDNIYVPDVEVNQNDYFNYSYSIICRLKDVNNNDY